MTHLVVGNGEVGSSLARVLRCAAVDIREYIDDTVKFLHICFPYNKNFLDQVTIYRESYQAERVIIHSTVPVGTSKRLGAWHSPIRGVHPNLEQGIRTFVKYLGVNTLEDPLVNELMDEFALHGVSIQPIFRTENTEAGKLLSTTYYAWNIMFEKWVYEYCKENDLNFDTVYTMFNNSYNEGYKKLGMEHVVRPVLKHHEGQIGGHCQIPNAHLLGDFEPAKIILKKNEEIGEEQTKETSTPASCS